MGQVIGELLPLAVALAISSPIAIIAVILILLAPRAGGTSAGFLVAWLVGIAGVTTVFLLLADVLDLGGDRAPSAAASWMRIALGGGLLLLAVRQWRSGPKPGEEPLMPKLMAAIDRFTGVKAAGLGLVLSAVDPKNLLMCAAAGAAIAGGRLSAVQNVWSVALFTVIAASTVAVPVIGYAIGRKRIVGPLESLRTGLIVHHGAVMATLLLVIAAVLIGKGLGGLA